MAALELLDLSMNRLTGKIPDGLFMLKNLSALYLYKNKFSGEIPQVIEASNLIVLDLSMNNLTGIIPDDIGKLQKLKILSLFFNQLSGEIPQSLGQIPTLKDVRAWFVQRLKAATAAVKMASETFVQLAIPRFDEPTAVMLEAQKAELEALKLKDLKAKNYLFQVIDRTILETILCKDTSKTMAIVNKLRTHGDKTQDVTIVEKILHSMTPKYNFVVYAIDEANDLDEMSLDELESSLLVHERKLNRQDKEELALKVSTDHYSSTPHKANRGRGKGNMDRRSHQTQSYDSQGRGRGRGKCHSATYKPKFADKSTVECYRCHRYRHYKSKCRANLPKMDGEKSHFAETEEEISLLMVCHAREENNKNLWYLNTGCSSHMCGDKSVFSTLDESFRDTVKFGDNSKISVIGKGQDVSSPSQNSWSDMLLSKIKRCGLAMAFSLWSLEFWRLKDISAENHESILGMYPEPAVFNSLLKVDKVQVLKYLFPCHCFPFMQFTSPAQHKSKAFVDFKSYKVLVEKEDGSPIKVLRTDHGEEYCSNEFAKFCDNQGIKRQITAAYTPQQNGVCERKNRTILDMDMTPEEAWSGRKPTVDHLRIFGCVAYAHVPDQKRKKLDNKGEKCIFLSVDDQSKAYKLYNPSTKKIVISRDVVFDEEQTWPGSKNGTSKCISVDFDGGDDEEKQQSIENVQQQLDMDEQQSASISNAPKDAQSLATAKEDEQRSQRVRKRPAWMTDYEVTGIDHSEDTPTHFEDTPTHFALFSDCDPTIFEEATTESKCHCPLMHGRLKTKMHMVHCGLQLDHMYEFCRAA
ncbi:hypothetical protein SLEP1_g23011 [Rubroshorea leprosula]|uniref:Integrase catalytic domain-containing protein n=1 Tax=Rubroshorea leprosula TaxID=152421 RepID=A0AAV5JLX9_9ROSI|nr:hypothetical protein SLEP1_g23011 [Rubroshorea leprosula]